MSLSEMKRNIARILRTCKESWGYFRGGKKGKTMCGREGGQVLSVNGQGGAVRGRGLAERCNRRDGIAEQSSARI